MDKTIRKAIVSLFSIFLCFGNCFVIAEENENDPESESVVEGEDNSTTYQIDDDEVVEESTSENNEVVAEESEDETDERIIDIWVNPEYEDIEYSTGLSDFDNDFLYSASDTYETVESAAEYLSSEMINRASSIAVTVKIPESQAISWQDLTNQIWEKAFEHKSDNPLRGDYLYWSLISAKFSYSGGSAKDGYWDNYITYIPVYHTNYSQEQEVFSRLNELVPSLNVGNGSEGEKVTAIYSYICNHVVYDYEHLNDKSYTIKHTAYAALINGTSVCQGYALLAYRMALMMGLDCRIITGNNHAWNIIRVGDLYYLCDMTWDSESYCAAQYKYYMRGKDNFTNHYPEKKYEQEPFLSQYPLAQTDYVYPDSIKVPVERIYIDTPVIELDALQVEKQTDIIVEPADAYDKTFSYSINSYDFSTSVSYNSRKGKNYKLSIYATKYGTANITFTIKGIEPFSTVVKCYEPALEKTLTVHIDNRYPKATDGVDYMALYDFNMPEEEILSDVNGERSKGLFIGSQLPDDSNTYTFLVPAKTYKLVAFKKGFIVRCTSIDINVQTDISISMRVIGDSNNDGEIDVSDIIRIRDYILGIRKTITQEDSTASDVNVDGFIDVSDIIRIRDIILGIRDIG